MNKPLKISLITISVLLIVSIISYFVMSYFIKDSIDHTIKSLLAQSTVLSSEKSSYDVATSMNLTPLIKNISFQHPSFRAPFRISLIKINKLEEFNIDIEIDGILLPVPNDIHKLIKDNSNIDIRQERFDLNLRQVCDPQTCTQKILVTSGNLFNVELEVIFTNSTLIKKSYGKWIASGISIGQMLNSVPNLIKYFDISNKSPATIAGFIKSSSSKPAVQLLEMIDASYLSGSTEVKFKINGKQMFIKRIAEKTGMPLGQVGEIHLYLSLSSTESRINIDAKQAGIILTFQSTLSSRPIIDALNVLRSVKDLNTLVSSVNVFSGFSLDFNILDDNLSKTSDNSIVEITKFINTELSKFKTKDNIDNINMFVEENMNLFKVQELSLHAGLSPEGFDISVSIISPLANINYKSSILLDDTYLFLQSYLQRDYASLIKYVRLEKMELKIKNKNFMDLAKSLVLTVSGKDDSQIKAKANKIIELLTRTVLDLAKDNNVPNKIIFNLFNVKDDNELYSKLSKSIYNLDIIEINIDNLDRELSLYDFFKYPIKALTKISIKI